jgi:hypothetical protein
MTTSNDYPLLQAYQTQDRIRDLLVIGYKAKDKGRAIMARDAFLKARELVNRTTGNKNVYRMIDSELRAMRIAADREERNRMVG